MGRLAAVDNAILTATHGGLIKRPPPLLVGVSKTHSATTIEEAITAGVHAFGENKVQEAEAKWPALKARYPHVELHLIGPLQSNKAADAVALFDVIQTIDRPKIADAVAKEASKQAREITALIQVNVGEEVQKAGVLPRDLKRLLDHCRDIGLHISGLMCIPPAGQNPAPYFALMQQMATRHGLKEISMGMSGDYVTAIRFGATMIRVGTALFGERVA